MQKKIRTLATVFVLLVVGVACLSCVSSASYALFYPDMEDYEGDGWRTTTDGVLTIESDQGWDNFLKYGYRDRVKTLFVGKAVTRLQLYDLPYDVPTEDFFKPEDVLWYGHDGEPYYGTFFIDGLLVSNIVVEEGNTTFRVLNGLLVNTKDKSVVLAQRNISNVIIPDGIKTITFQAFYNGEMTSIQFPNSLETIADSAFLNCTSLTGAYLPDSIKQLEGHAFSGCESLKNVRLPDGLNRIESHTFSRTGLEEMILPESLEEIGWCAFYACEELQKVVLSNNIRIIGDSAFWECGELMDVDFPEGLEKISFRAFGECCSFRQVILPDSLKQIGNEAFGGCDLLLLRLPNELEFVLYDEKSGEYKANPNATRDKAFDLSSVETVIFTGSDYDFGYHAITDAENVYFLGTPPEEVGSFLDKETVENIYCSDEFEFQWTRSKVSSWVRQKLTVLPAAELNAIVEEQINTTPIPLETPTPMPSETPLPTPSITPEPTATPILEAEETGIDPILFVFAGVIALVVAGIVVTFRMKKKRARHMQKKLRPKTQNKNT